jgi:hypothetical protein
MVEMKRRLVEFHVKMAAWTKGACVMSLECRSEVCCQHLYTEGLTEEDALKEKIVGREQQM